MSFVGVLFFSFSELCVRFGEERRRKTKNSSLYEPIDRSIVHHSAVPLLLFVQLDFATRK
jgi:hypothetical protein